MALDYNVVFEYTKEVEKQYQGVRTISAWESKEKFDEWYTPDIQKREIVIAEGISNEECQRLIRETPMSSYLSASREEATDNKGNVNEKVLELRLRTLEKALED